MHFIPLYQGKKLSLFVLLFLSLFGKNFGQSAVQFDGINDFVSFGTASPSLNASAFTLEAWIRIQGTGITTTTSGAGGGGLEGANAVVPLVTKGRGEAETPANVNINYFMGLVGNRLAADFEEATGPNHAIIGTTVIPLNTWTHVAATYDPATAVWNLYINGNPEATLDIGSNINPASTSIQHAAIATGLTSAGTAAGFFNGRMDEVRIWNVVRTPLEISSNFNTEISSGTGLIGRWGLNEGTGTAAGNAIGGSPSGVLTNGPTWTTGAPALDVPPAAPSLPSASSTAYYAVNISWTDNSGNETGFEIERSFNGINGNYTLLATTAANATSFTDILVAQNIEFCYRIRAVNGAGGSAYTNAVCATPPAEGANALDLGAAGAYVTFGAAPTLATPTFTIETWFKKTGAGVANTTGTGGISIIPILSKGSPEAENSNVDANYILGIQSGSNVIAADFEEGTGSTSPGLNHPVLGTTVITDNVWHHAAATFSNGVFRIYLDGELEGTLTLSPAVFPQGASIQHAALGTMITSTGTANGRFQGVLDEARIWNIEKSAAQIQASINDEITLPQSGLLARWGLNEGTGTIIHANAATIVNGSITGSGYSWVSPGAPFDLVFTPPAAPTSLTATATSNSEIQLSWADNANNETGFQIEQSTTGPGGSFNLIASVGANITSYNNSGLSAVSNYCYRVRAVKGSTVSSYTATECASTLTSGPVTVSLQDGVNSYSGTRDTYLYDVDPAIVRGAEITFVQDKNVADDRTSLLKFDLTGLPAGISVTSAMLQLYVDVEGQGFNMHRMLQPWDEGNISFASNGNRHFAANGTDAETAVNANWPGVDTYVGLISVPVPSATIQDWINGTLPNNGWLMLATHADDGQQLRSRETPVTADRPRLSITYAMHPPNIPVNPQPADNSTALSTSPNLCATVSDPDGGNLTVKFYGRKKTDPNAKFTIIGLPDTQFYTEEPQGQNSSGGGHNGIFKAQTQWIADHRTDSAIAFVVQLGDCVQNGDNPPGTDDQIEWRRADTSFKKIEFPAVPLADGIPYGICVGNHDQGTIGNPDGPSVFYNQYFGEARFTGRGYYGGHMGTNNDNHFELFSAGGIDFIHISIEYYPNGTTPSLQAALDWADALLKAFPNRKGIVSSHNLLSTGNPASFQGPGQKFYDDLKDNPNLILMLAGHVAGEGRRTDVFNGNTVHTLMSDYQSGYTNGGNGYLRIMQFIPAQNLLSVKTYSPYSGTSFTGSGSQFTLPVNLTTAYELIGTSINAASGTQTCVNWPSLEPGQIYEWYAEVIDESNNTTTGPVWTFTVPPPAPPSVTTQPQSQTICSGETVTFSSAASGDPVLAVYWQLSADNGNNWTTIPGETNSSLTFNATAGNDGYQYRSIWTNTAGNDTSNVAILSIQTYSITVTQNANGNISPAGITVQCHANQLFTISANNCFLISDVLVDGISVGPAGTYSFNDITADHTITAIYAPVVINILNSTAAVPIVCPGDNTGSISINASGGTAPFEYSIDGGNNYSNSNSFTNLAGAVYAVRIRDANGCTKDTSISLEPVVVHWTGTLDNNWHNAGNWSSNKVPDALTHVVIDGGTPNVCLIGTANAEAASLRVKPAADFEIATGFALNISANCGTLPPE